MHDAARVFARGIDAEDSERIIICRRCTFFIAHSLAACSVVWEPAFPNFMVLEIARESALVLRW